MKPQTSDWGYSKIPNPHKRKSYFTSISPQSAEPWEGMKRYKKGAGNSTKE